MASRKSLMLGVLFVLVSSAGVPAMLQSQKTELEGTWEGVRSVVGTTERTFKPGEVTMTFAGDKLLAKGIVAPDEQPLAFKINSTTSPKQFDYTAGGKTQECIYTVDGDQLTIAVPRTAGRPKAIAPDMSMVIMTLKRKK